MEIMINYHSSWRVSVLEEETKSNRTKRKFKASSKSSNDLSAKLTLSTILGLLSRLIGDQRKLHQAQNSKNYFFKGLEELITFAEVSDKTVVNDETVMLINKSEKKPGQKSFIGVVDENTSQFFSEYAYWFWSILDKDFNELLDIIKNPSKNLPRKSRGSERVNIGHLSYQAGKTATLAKFTLYEHQKKVLTEKLEEVEYALKLDDEVISEKLKKQTSNKNVLIKKGVNTSDIEQLITDIQKQKKDKKDAVKYLEEIAKIDGNQELIQLSNNVKDAVNILVKNINGVTVSDYLNDENQSIYLGSLYAGALYYQIEQMKELDINPQPLLNPSGTIPGFSKRKLDGNRGMFQKFSNKKASEHLTRTPVTIKKATGKLVITLDISKEKSKELKEMIENAGVSSFYLGKKGLAYVTSIRT